MTNQDEMNKRAEEFVTEKISFGGLEHSIGGPIHNECVESFKAGWQSRDPEIETLNRTIALLREHKKQDAAEIAQLREEIERLRK